MLDVGQAFTIFYMEQLPHFPGSGIYFSGN